MDAAAVVSMRNIMGLFSQSVYQKRIEPLAQEGETGVHLLFCRFVKQDGEWKYTPVSM